ncbi:MAG TPA: hypothetical protein VMZ00_15485 [Sporichthya sp.]|nr:hypothetical protein [Sporichthya sp.]
MPARTIRTALRLTALALTLSTGLGASAPTADAGMPRGGASGPAIEDPAGYQPQFLCRKSMQPGVRAFRALILKQFKTTSSASDVRACSSSHTSEHADGRAWDWGVRASKKKERKKAEAVLTWLLAPDQYGNDFAMARRLGIMYIIWNKQMWRSYSGEWGPYSCSGTTSCHQDHIHFSFGWAGAYKKTSFWTGTVAQPMGPPLPLFDSLTSPWRVPVNANQGQKWGAKTLGGGLLYTVTAAGTWKYGTQELHRADAACRMNKNGEWVRDPSLRVTGVWNLVPTVPSLTGCNTVNHTYLATLTPTFTDAVSFAISDAKPGDNSGVLDVTIRRVLALPDLGLGGGGPGGGRWD